jgi:hypothetical protein
MGKESRLKHSLEKVASVFKEKGETEKGEKEFHIPVIHLNFFLLSAVFKKIQRGLPQKPLSLFTTKIISSKNKHFKALINQAERVCSKQDLELFSYKAFYSQNHFALRRAVQWKLSKYIKTEQEAIELLSKMKNSSSDSFKSHLITLLKDEKLTSQEIEEEAKRLKDQYTLWRYAPS